MSQAEMIVELENPRPVYHPGEVFSARYHLAADQACDIKSIEASLLWRTEGKGDEDLGVHLFEEIKLPEEERRDRGEVRRLTTKLPRSPLSYDGLLVKVLWCVRVRAYLVGGKEVVGEATFQLGEVARGQEVEKS